MTLFAAADPSERIFSAVLDRFYAGDSDSETDRLLGR